MKCPMCGGDGITDKFTPNVGRCIKCNGSGEIEPTNEEWLHSLNTEQLAEFIIKTMLFYDNAGITVLDAIKNAVEDNENLSKYFIENVVEWLKQPHTQGDAK